MTNFKVVVEIELEAETALDAAKELKQWMDDGWDFQAYVQNSETDEVVSVDLQEEDEDAVLPTALSDYQPLIDTVIE